MDYNQSLQTERRRRGTRILLIGILVLVVLAGGLMYTAFFTNLLRFDEIIVRGTSLLTKEGLFGERPPPFLFQSVRIYDPLVANFSTHKDIFQKTLVIDIEERMPYGVLCSGHNVSSTAANNCLWFDADGILFARAPATLGMLVPGIYDAGERELLPGEYVLPRAQLRKMFEIFEILHETEVRATKFILLDLQVQEIHAVTREGTIIYFSLRLDPAFTLEALQSLKSQFGELEYIDFRSENRVFYK